MARSGISVDNSRRLRRQDPFRPAADDHNSTSMDNHGTRRHHRGVATEGVQTRGVALAAGARSLATPTPVNRRNSISKKQRIQVLQRPMSLFTRTQI